MRKAAIYRKDILAGILTEEKGVYLHNKIYYLRKL